jgi:glycosyltransferase involved in cell wall biosynthesis
MKIFFNRVIRKEAYGGGSHFVTSMVNYLQKKGHEVIFYLHDLKSKKPIEDIDLIFLIDPRSGDIGYSINHVLEYKSKINPNVKILHRVNECDARKNSDYMDNILIQTSMHTDKTIFISEWLKKYFIEKDFKGAKTAPVIYNGCKLDHFYPSKEKKKNKKIKIVTHHWSDNWMKGFDLYKFIDQEIVNENYEFTYVGRYCKEYKPKNTQLINPLWGPALGEELRKHDIYVTASRFEPCGMHHIEGAASGMPVIYHEDCGGINELCKKHGKEYNSFDDFKKALGFISTNINDYKHKIDYNALDIERCCEKFYQEILGIFS